MYSKQQSGFTLIELAVVVFLIGLLASVGLSALNAQLNSSHISDTKKKQDIIKDALLTYLGKNKRLPCPATDNTGNESRILGTIPTGQLVAPMICTGYFGYIPYTTLGLPKSTALDGWENFFSYAVSSQWTLTYSSTIPTVSNEFTNAATLAFNAGIPGSLKVNDRNPPTSAVSTPLSTNATFILLSHGKNGLGALTSKGTKNISPDPTDGQDELANVPNSPTWLVPALNFKREYTDIVVPTYGPFDDVILYLNPSDLINALSKDGAIKSPESQWMDQAVTIANAVSSYMIMDVNGSCSPPTTALLFSSKILTPNGIPSIDPWGRTLNYVRCIDELQKDGDVSKTPNLNLIQFINATTGATQNYDMLCTIDTAGNPTQLAFALTVTTNSTTAPITMQPVFTNFTVAKLLGAGANSSFIDSNCP